MESHEVEDFDPNWVSDFCLFEDIPPIYGDSLSLDSANPWPTLPPDLLNIFHGSSSISVSTQQYSGGSLAGLNEGIQKSVPAGISTSSNSKACREKMRRDRLNERLLELSAVLEFGKIPKYDKAAILTDAIRKVNMLREETTRLKGQNMELKLKIIELKAEKNELRSEKHRLKTEKEEIEQRIKALGGHLDIKLLTTAIPSPYTIPCQVVGGNKMVSFVNNYPLVPLWQYVDTLQDHVLHPPVA